MRNESFEPHYAVIFTAVIFTSKRTSVEQGYGDTAQRMVELAQQQPGFIGVESARNEVGITVSYRRTLEDITR
jgi:heme-degrading monooxygenase HmoA